ncbi:MAG TPA: tetratricopeptide repeat protein, partial [Phycisphaerales bacterium]|nr:tetratricopeptide repeat protein [Phycisphaerales bacterium]
MAAPEFHRPLTSADRSSSNRRLVTAAGGCATALAVFLTACQNPFVPEWQREGQPEPGVGTVGGPGHEHIEAGEAALDAGNNAAAMEEFAKAIAINPTLTDAHMGMGDIYRIEGDFAKAEKSYGEAARLAPKNFDAQYYHGLMLHLLDRVTDAVGAYLQALSVKPEDFQTNLNLSVAYYQLGETTQAYTFGERAVKIDPRNGPARVNLAAVYADLGRHEEAVTEFQQSFELVESTPRILLAYAESLRALGRYGEMRSTLDQLVKKVPSAAAWERLGYAQFKLGDYAGAAASFDSSLKVDPDYFPALNGVAVCRLNDYLSSSKRDDAARQEAVAALRRSLGLE